MNKDSPSESPNLDAKNNGLWKTEHSILEELQHASEMALRDESEDCVTVCQISRSRRSSTGSLRLEIQDLGTEDSVNFTTSTLRKCKQLVLRPYWGLLVFIGWRGFNKESMYAHRQKWRCLNILYTSVIILLLFYTYMYEVLACEWKLDIKSEVKVVSNSPFKFTTPRSNKSLDARDGHHTAENDRQSDSNLSSSVNLGCEHIVTTYLVPNLLHFVAYLMGIYYFRIQENEQLYALMEKVFLQATPVQTRTASQQKMIYKLRVFLIVGAMWVLLAVVLQCLYVWAFDFPRLSLFERSGTVGYWLLLAFELVGRTVFNSVILAIVMNYATQCEMIKFYVRGLGMRLQEKSTDLKIAMKDLLMLRHSLSLLNGTISKMTSLASIILAELTVIGLSILFLNNLDDIKVWTYRVLFPIVWVIMLSVPLVQAARVNSMCLRIQKTAIEMRVFGYKGASILDLDSFLQFVTVVRFKAKLFHITIVPSRLISLLIITAFILLILIQTSMIGSSFI